MSINTIQDQIIEDFSRLDGWFDKYEYLINAGQSLQGMEEYLRTEDNQINGCQSQVWLIAEQKDDKFYFTADSDALITRGLLALLMRILNGQSRQDIEKCDLYFIEQTGLGAHLSPSRANGLAYVVKQMKQLDQYDYIS